MLYEEEPKGFSPKFEAAGCFIENEGKILLLHRRIDKPHGNTWGLPSGTIENNETPLSAMLRELEEETGIQLESPVISHYQKVFVKYSEYDFLYHIFYIRLDGEGKVRIDSNEHKEFTWIHPKDALKLPLIHDLDTCIRIIYKI